MTTLTLSALQAAIAALPADQGRILESTVMRAAFELVADKADWKNAVSARVYADCCDFEDAILARAVAFMTATTATITRDGCFIVVKAPGYYAGPAC